MVVATAGAWQRARVVEARDVADRIRRLVLEPASPRPVKAGEHLDVRLDLDGTPTTRSYSIVDASPTGDRVALSVLHTRNSRGGSTRMHELAVGDELDVSVPLQDFPLRIGAPRYVLVAGGIGITAIAAMAAVLRRVRADYLLVYVGRSRPAMAYLDALRDEHGERLRIHVDDEGAPLRVDDLVAGIDPGTELYMCGPIRLMDAIRRAWLDRGLDRTALRFETFGNSGWFEPEPFEVEVPRLGVTVTVGTDQSMLHALERAGVDMMFDCRKGECGICQVSVVAVEGVVDHRDVFFSDAQKQATTKLCCCVSRAANAPAPQGSPVLPALPPVASEPSGRGGGGRPRLVIDVT